MISQACVSATSTPKPIQEKVGCTLTSTSEFQSLPTGCQPSSTSPAQNVQGDDSLISKPSTQRIAKFGKAEYAAYDDARRSNEPSSPETNVVLRAALKPFATDADIYDDQGIDDGEKSFKDNITVGDLRRARAALAASEGSTE